VICGTPTPATIRVVQIEPGPIPTLTASAPASSSASAASPVTMLPPITCTFGKFFLTQATRSITPCEWPCAVSTTITSTPASTRASTRCFGVAAGADGGADRRRSLILGRRSGCRGLLDVLDGDQAAQGEVVVDHQHLLDAVLVQQPSTSSSDAPSLTVTRRSFLVMMWRHRLVQLLLEAHVAAGDDADQIVPPSTTGTPEMLRAWVSAALRRWWFPDPR
jgi:hypothetical protein